MLPGKKIEHETKQAEHERLAAQERLASHDPSVGIVGRTGAAISAKGNDMAATYDDKLSGTANRGAYEGTGTTGGVLPATGSWPSTGDSTFQQGTTGFPQGTTFPTQGTTGFTQGQQPWVAGTSGLGTTGGFASSGGTIPGGVSQTYPAGTTTNFGPSSYGGPTAAGSPAIGYPPSATLGQSGLTSAGATSGFTGYPIGTQTSTSGDVPPMFGQKLATAIPGTAGYGAGLVEAPRVPTVAGTEVPISTHATEALRDRALLKDPNVGLGSKVGAALSFVKHDIAASNEKMSNMSTNVTDTTTTKPSTFVPGSTSDATVKRSTGTGGTSSTSY
jgi:hypothetical protein